MAGYGAHITITANEKPSIFDVVAQESFLETFEPAFKHILQVIGEKNPVKLNWCLTYANEVYLALHSLLQYHYLSNYGASFAENFYDLKRIPLKDTSFVREKPLSLDSKSLIKSLLGLTMIPYVRQLLNNYYYRTVEAERGAISREKGSKGEKVRRLFITVWPKVHLMVELTNFYYYIRYATGTEKVHSPLLHLVGVRLASLTETDFEFLEERSTRLTFSNIRCLRDAVWWLMESGGTALQNSLELGAFFLQFLDWFYSSESALSKNVFGNLSPIPAPPQSSEEKMDKTKCPVCLQDREKETVLAVSGYVFCYSCIFVYVKREGKCPVTGYRATTKQLIKIFQD